VYGYTYDKCLSKHSAVNFNHIKDNIRISDITYKDACIKVLLKWVKTIQK